MTELMHSDMLELAPCMPHARAVQPGTNMKGVKQVNKAPCRPCRKDYTRVPARTQHRLEPGLVAHKHGSVVEVGKPIADKVPAADSQRIVADSQRIAADSQRIAAWTPGTSACPPGLKLCSFASVCSFARLQDRSSNQPGWLDSCNLLSCLVQVAAPGGRDPRHCRPPKLGFHAPAVARRCTSGLWPLPV